MAPFVDAVPSVELVPLAVVDCEALPVADCSPVVVVAVWPEAWLPVVVVAVVSTDWLPVVVALSIERLERPRRSMLGLKPEVEPVTDVSWLVVDPVIDEPCVVEDPLTVGFAVAVPAASTPVAADPLTEADVSAGFVALADVVESGMQSMWTGLDERSPALPLSLPASLPAFGWFSSLHFGVAVEAALVEAPELVVEVLALSLNCAHAGAVPSRAARVSVLR